jgi:hypothetical protein
MPQAGQLNVNDRVLLHLSRFATDIPPEEYPPDTTQAGIAVAVGISRTHVPRAVRGLIKDGLVTEMTARVKGHERRMNIYAATAEGLNNAERIWRAVRESTFPVISEGKTVEMLGKDIEAMVGRKRALAVVSGMRNGVISIEEKRRAPVRELKEAPALDAFYGREAELRAMDEFMDSDAKVLVVLGNKGYGTTALTRKFIDGLDEEDILWVQLTHRMTASELEARLTDFGRKIGKHVANLADVLSLETALVVFDDYFSVSEELVEFFSALVDSTKDLKIIVNARQETPAYNWFYQRKHVDAGIVKELRIRGLDEASAKKLLGNERIEKDALKRIMMMTHGQPMILEMLKMGDSKGLKDHTVFTAEEIRYLLFLKGKTQ